MRNPVIVYAIICVALLGASGCGYHVAGKADLMPATIKTIAIPAFANRTIRYKLARQLPAEPGQHSVVPPRAVGGNLDIRDLAEGTTLYLPVEVEGALFSVGDTHAAQGDGEVCGTAIESQMDVELTLDLVKGANLKSPRFSTPGPVTRHLDGAGYEATTGLGPDLMTATREAVARMIDLLAAEHGLNPIDAYLLLSVCGDLRISEVVDQPNWIVSFYFPRIVFT